MEIRDGGNVPGVTGQGTRQKAAGVVDEMGDNHFDELQWKLGGRGQPHGWNRWQIMCGECPNDPVPNSLNESLNRRCWI